MADAIRTGRRAGLRTRASIAFALLALLLSVSLAFLTYGLARRYLLSKREAAVTQQAIQNARTVAGYLQSPTVEPTEILVNLAPLEGSRSVLRLDGRWYAASIDTGRATIPKQLQAVHGNHVQRQRVVAGRSTLLVVAVPIEPGRGTYFDVVRLDELQTTLRTLATILGIAAAITTVSGALVGRAASRRVLRPIRTMATAAVNIAEGKDEPRLTTSDADLEPFIRSFNDMVDALHERANREASFASNVSHELRTPLTAIRSAVDVLDRRIDEGTRPALEILRRQTNRFEQLVLDLLEISRLDAGAGAMDIESTSPAGVVEQALRRSGHLGIEVIVDESAPGAVRLDRRRIQRVITNLVENADHYAGGVVRIGIAGTSRTLLITVDDTGPGVPPAERSAIFDRFHRGAASRGASTPGTGLGLAIAAGHCELHGGHLLVGESPEGGARFTIELPREQPE